MSDPIQPGEQIVCENGHLICTAKVEITDLAGVVPANFDFVVEPGRQQANCPTCGVRYAATQGMTQDLFKGRDDSGAETETTVGIRYVTAAKLHVADRGWVVLHRSHPYPTDWPKPGFEIVETGAASAGSGA